MNSNYNLDKSLIDDDNYINWLGDFTKFNGDFCNCNFSKFLNINDEDANNILLLGNLFEEVSPFVSSSFGINDLGFVKNIYIKDNSNVSCNYYELSRDLDSSIYFCKRVNSCYDLDKDKFTSFNDIRNKRNLNNGHLLIKTK